jgi:HK97 family phage major capsid protein
MKNQIQAAAIAALQAQLVDIHQRETEIHATADRETRELTDAETKELDELAKKFDRVDADLKRKEGVAARGERLEQPSPRAVSPAEPAPKAAAPQTPRITGGDYAGATPGSGGFRSFGEYAVAVRGAAGVGAVNMDERLRILAAATTYGNESSQADGGFAVPPDFRTEIVQKVQAEEGLLARTDQQFTSGNRITVPMDNTTPWQTSGGILAAWEDEAATYAQTKPAFEALEVKANKLFALVPMTDELLEDVPALSKYLPGKVAAKFTSKINDGIVNGNGVGKPKGLLNAGSKVTVGKESGQATGTLVFANIVKMWSRMYGALRSNAVWLINQDIEPQLLSMTVPGTQPNFPAYMPPGGLSGAPYGSLLGRPVIPVEACQGLSTEGDIILWAPQTYLTVQKTSGIRQDVSMHVYFDQNMTAFRFITRLGGQSWWAAAIARQNGSNTLSNIVTLQTR